MFKSHMENRSTKQIFPAIIVYKLIIQFKIQWAPSTRLSVAGGSRRWLRDDRCADCWTNLNLRLKILNSIKWW